MVVLAVSLPCLGGRQVALPVLLGLFRPKDDDHPHRPSQPELARTLIDMILRRFPGRVLELVMDGAYASRAWRGLPDHVTVTTRMRANAALHKPAPIRQSGQKGRPPLKGSKLPTLAEIAATATFRPVTVTSPDGRERTVHVHELICLWCKPFYTRAVKVILIRNPGTSETFDVAIASTDVEVPADTLLSRYDSRWTIETCNQEAKAHGVGEARNRVQRVVERTVPFGFLTQTITICWYQLHGDPDTDLTARRRHAPWYRQKTTVSYSDMLAALRRELIRHEFWTQAPPMTTNPKVAQPQSPSAQAAA
ncbi:MAG: transposase [Solirubrobacteraceae bacterium]